MTTPQPLFAAKSGVTLDGKVATRTGDSKWITGEAARNDGHHWRARACAVLTGIGTVRDDDPQLTVRAVTTPRQPLRVVIDSRLELPLTARILEGGGVLIACAIMDEAKAAKLTDQGAEIVALPNAAGKVALPALMQELGRRGINELHVEAGHRLNGSLINEHCVDELLLYLAPSLLGERTARLRIHPRAVNPSSEVLTPETRTMVARAWDVAPFNVYAATETGGIAAECVHHHGMHLFEDLVVPEVVDDAYRPVPNGEAGSRLLVTVLSSRTLPLIRYEMTDRVRLAAGSPPCGMPFALLESIEGRTDDVLTLPAAGGGTVRVHPVVFHQVLDLLVGAGWQVRQENGGLRVLVASPAGRFDPHAIEVAVRRALAAAGANSPPVEASSVDTIPAGAAGKRPLVVNVQS